MKKFRNVITALLILVLSCTPVLAATGEDAARSITSVRASSDEEAAYASQESVQETSAASQEDALTEELPAA